MDRIVLNLKLHLALLHPNLHEYESVAAMFRSAFGALESKLSIMEAGGGRLKKTINMVKIELIPILTDRNVCIK